MGIVIFDRESLATAPISNFGDKISTPKPVSQTYPYPHHLYLIYFGRDRAGVDKIVHAYSPLIQNDFTITANNLFDIAQAYDHGPLNPSPPEIVDLGFDDKMIWKNPVFICLVVDIDNHEWVWDPRGMEPITFVEEKLGTTYDENHSFYNAISGRIRNRPSVHLANYFKYDANGNNVGQGQSRKYCMNFNMLVPVVGGRPSVRQWDPDTENQGPGGGGLEV